MDAKHVLRVLTKDGRWENMTFHSHTDVDAMAKSFLEQHGLRPAFRAGLADFMRQMAATGQMQSSVDVIDLL
jgi:hypothetical protein